MSEKYVAWCGEKPVFGYSLKSIEPVSKSVSAFEYVNPIENCYANKSIMIPRGQML